MLVYNLRNKYFIIFLEQCQQLRKFRANGNASTYLAVNYTYGLCPEIPLGKFSKTGLKRRAYLACLGIALLNDGFMDCILTLACTSLDQRYRSGVKIGKIRFLLQGQHSFLGS